MLESQEMRKVYCDTMIALAKEDPRIVDVEADLTGAHGMKPFKAAYPDRSFNVGIAEANMVGVAAGLSALRPRSPSCILSPHSLPAVASTRSPSRYATPG